MKLHARLVSALVVFGLLAIAPFWSGTPEFWITLSNYVGLAALVALGLVVLTGIGGMTSFGQAAFVGIGAYTSGVLTLQYGMSPWLTLFAGLALTALLAFALGAITLRLSGHYLPLCTIAWGISLYYLFGNLESLGRYDGLNGLPPIRLFGHPLSAGRDIHDLIWALVLVAVWMTLNLLDSRPGRAIRALQGGAPMAESFGIHTARYRIVAFVYAAMLASVSGWLYAHLQRSINPTPFGLNAGIEYLFMAVAGGAGHVWGALAGAALITVARDQLQDVLPRLLGSNGNFEVIVFGVLLVWLLQRARDGLWPYLARVFATLFGAAPKRQTASGFQPLQRRSMPARGTTLLEVSQISRRFGGLTAVNGLSFSLRAGEIVGLIGPNGAGKSTTFNLISGVLPLSHGEIRFLSERVDGQSARQMARRGMARTFQHVQLLSGMSVRDNVALGAHQRAPVGLARAALRLERSTEARILGEAMRQLERVGLAGAAGELAGNLALGQQRILEIARALAADPVLLLLDEPAAGLRYQEKQILATVLRGLRDEGLSILLVEHDMDFVMGLTDHLVVMDFGVKLAEGRPEQVRDDPKVLEAYLGGIDEPLTASGDGA